jgi:hypothetical protein
MLMPDVVTVVYEVFFDSGCRRREKGPLGAFFRHAVIGTILCMLCTAPARAAQPPVAPLPSSDARAASPLPTENGSPRNEASYENATLTEDTTWRGTVLIRGYLVIAPQATVRIEPGTTVRFMKSAIFRQVPRLVVMGRIHANGSPERPVVFAPAVQVPEKGTWGGILLLSSEKRNQLEHVRIEGADKGIEAHFSSLTVKGVAITRAGTGLLLRDSTVTLTGARISNCGTALEIHDSELDLRESALNDNRQGIAAYRCGLALTSVSVTASEREGLIAEECRIRLAACDLSGNAVGASVKGGEGQISLTRATRNREAGLLLSDARLKVHRCLIADNTGDGVRVKDGRALVWASSFGGNSGYHLANAGRGEVSAVLNWWGSAQEAAVMSKLLDSAADPRAGRVISFPWLTEPPAALP